jgi:hypothetical protein
LSVAGCCRNGRGEVGRSAPHRPVPGREVDEFKVAQGGHLCHHRMSLAGHLHRCLGGVRAGNATQVAEVVGASPSVTSWHLRHLASFGLVKEWEGGTDARQRWWQAAARGFRVDLPAGDEGRAAYQALASELINAGLNQARAWLVEVAPGLDDTWMAQSEGTNTRLMVTPEELGELRGRIEELLAPFLASTRDPQPGAQGVRMLRFCLPEAED